MNQIRVLRITRAIMIVVLVFQVLSISVAEAVSMRDPSNTHLEPLCASCTATLEYWDGSTIHTLHPACTVTAIQNTLLDVSGTIAPQVTNAGWVVVDGAGGWRGLECVYSTLGQGDNFAGYCNYCEDFDGLSGGN